jgi:putative modified peptide
MATKKGAGAKKQAAPLDPKVADRLLDLLSTDNEFRRLFKKDPQAALVKAGWKPPKETAASGVTKARKGPPFPPPGPPTEVPPVTCMKVDRIAPKDQIIKSRSELKAMLTSGLGQQPVHLNVSGGAPQKLR